MTDSQDLPPTEALTRRSRRESGGAAPASSPKGGGLRGLIAKHPRAWLFSALGVAFLILATSAVFAGIAVGSGDSVAATPDVEEEIPPRVQPSAIPTSSHLRTCSIASAAADGYLGTLAASVINASTGEVLFDRGGTTAQPPASIVQLLTAAAALQVLGPDARLSTRVVEGSSPGTIVLVGGGDPTLATTSSTVYEGAPLLEDLADAAMAAYEAKFPTTPITQIVLDATMWDASDAWDASWPTSERTQGYQAPVTALMVDGARADPSETISPRSSDPIADAGAAFAAAAGLEGVNFSRGTAIGSTILAQVQSQPVSVLIDQMLESSDNTLGEMLARVVSKSSSFNGSAASLQQAIPGALTGLGAVETNTLTIKDGSGESALNAVPPQFLAKLLVKIRAGEGNLGIIASALPIAGQTGDLYDRFTGGNAVAAGIVQAKTGWIDNDRSLAGFMTAADGTPLTFAFYALGEAVTADTMTALDTLTTAAYNCGNNLSNN